MEWQKNSKFYKDFNTKSKSSLFKISETENEYNSSVSRKMDECSNTIAKENSETNSNSNEQFIANTHQ